MPICHGSWCQKRRVLRRSSPRRTGFYRASERMSERMGWIPPQSCSPLFPSSRPQASPAEAGVGGVIEGGGLPHPQALHSLQCWQGRGIHPFLTHTRQSALLAASGISNS